MNPKSPTRVVMNAFLLATAAALRSNQKPISRYEQSPTPSHPTNVTRKLLPSTSTSIDATNRFMYAKNRPNRGSPCMYPIAKTWMSRATPVTNRIHVTESGSTRKPNFTLRPPETNQSKMLRTWARGVTSRSAKNVTTDHTKEHASSPLPIHPASGSPIRLPKSNRMIAPAIGNAGTSHTRSSTSRELIRAAAGRRRRLRRGGAGRSPR